MKFPSLTLLITICIIALYLAFGANPEALVWQQNTTDVWRWLSGHFVHISTTHLVWNLVAFILLGSIIEQYRKRDLIAGLGIGIAAINLYLELGYSLSAYAGLSGVLNTLLVIALFHLCCSDTYRNAAMLTLVGSMLKIVIEMNSGRSLVAHLAWPPVPEAHLIGWLAGIALCIMLGTQKRKYVNWAQEV